MAIIATGLPACLIVHCTTFSLGLHSQLGSWFQTYPAWHLKKLAAARSCSQGQRLNVDIERQVGAQGWSAAGAGQAVGVTRGWR